MRGGAISPAEKDVYCTYPSEWFLLFCCPRPASLSLAAFNPQCFPSSFLIAGVLNYTKLVSCVMRPALFHHPYLETVSPSLPPPNSVALMGHGYAGIFLAFSIFPYLLWRMFRSPPLKFWRSSKIDCSTALSVCTCTLQRKQLWLRACSNSRGSYTVSLWKPAARLGQVLLANEVS